MPVTSLLTPAKRVSNFNAGPGPLPLAVLEIIREELLDYRGTGMSVMEMSHRSAEYEAVSYTHLTTYGAFSPLPSPLGPWQPTQ